MNTPVNFELAKLLKEKGFDEDCNFYYSESFEIESFEYYHIDRKYSDYTGYPDDVLYFAPTIAEVVMWLYEKHGIWIYPRQSSARLGFRCFIQRLRILGETDIQNDEVYESPTEAYEAAILYTLNNLI